MRTKGQRVTPQTRTQFGPRAVKVKGCLLWNNINKNILSNRFFKSFKDHLASTICLHTKEMNIDKIFKWQRCEFTKRYFCHNCRLFSYPYIVLDSPVYFKYFICVFNLHFYCQLSFTVSSLACSDLGCLMNMWTFQATRSMWPWASRVTSNSNQWYCVLIS